MAGNLATTIAERFDAEPTEKLLALWVENDRATWSDDAFRAMQLVLQRRGVEVPARQHSNALSTDKPAPKVNFVARPAWIAGLAIVGRLVAWAMVAGAAFLAAGTHDAKEHNSYQVHLCILPILARVGATGLVTAFALGKLGIRRWGLVLRLLALVANLVAVVDAVLSLKPLGRLGILEIREDYPFWLAILRTLDGPRLAHHNLFAIILIVLASVGAVATLATFFAPSPPPAPTVANPRLLAKVLGVVLGVVALAGWAMTSLGVFLKFQDSSSVDAYLVFGVWLPCTIAITFCAYRVAKYAFRHDRKVA